MRSARRRPVLIVGVLALLVVAIVATAAFGGRLPWNSPSIPLAETSMQGSTVIDVPTDDSNLSVAPGKGGRLDIEGASLVIPAGAAVSNSTVTVKILQGSFHMTAGAPAQDSQDTGYAVGPVVDFGPEGTTFNEPVTISVPYDHTFLPKGTSEDSIRPAYWNGQSWVVLAGVVDKSADTVSVKLKDFKGVAVLAVVVGAVMVTAVGVALKTIHDNWGELKWSDPVTKGTAKEYVTPNNPIVQMYASKAVITDGNTHTQMALDDPKMPDWLAKASQDGHNMNLGYLDRTGKVTQPAWDEAKGSNWQKPDDFFLTGDANGPLHGDCTDDANSSVSVFIASGFQAKGVFGRDVKDGGVHAWAEVSIGGKLYKMDAAGIYSPERWTSSGLPTYAPDTWGRHDDSMWDDQGQKPYDKDWWKKSALSASVVTTSGLSATLKASATGLPSTSKKAMLSWDFGAGPADYKTFTAPLAEPLVSNVTHAFADKGSYPVTVILYDTSSGSQVELSRVTISVQIGAPSPSPSRSAAPSPGRSAKPSAGSSASAGPSATAEPSATNPGSTASAGHGEWIMVSTAGVAGTSSRELDHYVPSDGRMTGSEDGVATATISWGRPPASAAPGDVWDTKVSVKFTCNKFDAAWPDAYGVNLEVTFTATALVDGVIEAGGKDTTYFVPGRILCTSATSVVQKSLPMSLDFPSPAEAYLDSDPLDPANRLVVIVHVGSSTWSYIYKWKP